MNLWITVIDYAEWAPHLGMHGMVGVTDWIHDLPMSYATAEVLEGKWEGFCYWFYHIIHIREARQEDVLVLKIFVMWNYKEFCLNLREGKTNQAWRASLWEIKILFKGWGWACTVNTVRSRLMVYPLGKYYAVEVPLLSLPVCVERYPSITGVRLNNDV